MNRVFGASRTAFILILVLCAGSTVLFAKDPLKLKNSAAPEVIVLQPADPIPPQAIKLSSIQINDTAGCAYFEIMKTVKNLAGKAGGNIVKVTQHISRGQGRNCDEVSATFYKTGDVHALEKEIPWQQGRKLAWNDFKGEVPASAGENTAAVTYCGIGFETNKVTATNKARVFVYNTFYKNQSWVRDGERTPDILAHEQGHFDICEIYTRKLRERIAATHITVYNLKTTLQQIYDEVNNEYENRQEAYEHETQHGTITAIQQKWLALIAQELDGTEDVALF